MHLPFLHMHVGKEIHLYDNFSLIFFYYFILFLLDLQQS